MFFVFMSAIYNDENCILPDKYNVCSHNQAMGKECLIVNNSTLFSTTSSCGNHSQKTLEKNQQVHDYMKHHLLIKSCLDKERSLLRTGVKKISIRNYTPKILGQEINMGMWM